MLGTGIECWYKTMVLLGTGMKYVNLNRVGDRDRTLVLTVLRTDEILVLCWELV